MVSATSLPSSRPQPDRMTPTRFAMRVGLPRRRGKSPAGDDRRPRAPREAQVVLQVMDASPAGGTAAPRPGRGAPGKRGCSVVQHSHGQPSSTGLWSSRYWALAMLSRPPRTNSCPLRALRVGITQSNMSTPGADRGPEVVGRADAHQVARAVGGHLGGDRVEHPVHHLGRLADRQAAERQPVERAAPRSRPGARGAGPGARPPARCRSAAGPAPPARPGSAAPSGSCAPSPPRSPARGASAGGHSSNAIAMSRRAPPGSPSRARACSRCSLPSRCERNVTPSSSTVRRSAQAEHLEAARVGEDRARPAHEAVQPAERRDPLRARAQHQVIGVAEDDPRAQPLELGGRQRLDGGLRADRHEHRRLDHAVRGLRAARRAPAAADAHHLGSAHVVRDPGSASRRRSCRSGSRARPPRGRPPAPGLAPANAATSISSVERGRWKFVIRSVTTRKRVAGQQEEVGAPRRPARPRRRARAPTLRACAPRWCRPRPRAGPRARARAIAAAASVGIR